ncbi:hypothetical protein [Streptomyces albus]|uniref:hypothetical protein n=1 Tax=Streptomyces albus TaxID=1888 RepID=UPI0034572240
MDSTHNRLAGTHGVVIQARDITGDITLTTHAATDNSDQSHNSHTAAADTVTFTNCTVNYVTGTNHGGMHH